MTRFYHSRVALCTLYILAGLVLADPNDWVNVNYVLQQAGSSSSTSSAQQNIISKAGGTAKSGPWSVVTKNSVLPPSKNIHDYLSWAPYHWPDCNWCSRGTAHITNPGATNGSTSGDSSGDGSDSDPDGYDSDPYEDGGGDESVEDETLLIALRDVVRSSTKGGLRPDTFAMLRKMRRVNFQKRAVLDTLSIPTPTVALSFPGFPQPTIPPVGPQTSQRVVSGTPAPAQAGAKTSSCTPSPTKSLAPSATWTTCPYAVRDGKVNPDVRTLPDSPAAVDMAQSILYNAVAYGVSKTSTYSKNVAAFIDAFFLTSATAMNPNMNFGQLVRGPGKTGQMGTFTGILDMRGMVKVVNAIQILKATKSPDWTSGRDTAMTSWTQQYATWLQTSTIGKQTAAAPNNHFSFYINQLASTKMLAGDTDGAASVLKGYFGKQYLDQIAASGEQPFEAVRTRPYHYRCFNLEAMITNAKLGDQLGINFWIAKSKYGATIQTALDYTMSLNPKEEDVSDIFPHVAAVAAAYGDPSGKYKSFLQNKDSNFQSQPFWFYDQTGALPNSPAHHKRDNNVADAPLEDTPSVVNYTTEKIPFECPAVFLTSPSVEIEDGLYVTCDELEPFYEIATGSIPPVSTPP